MIWYSQEAREYGLLAALCAASLIFFARAWHAPGSRRDLVWWTVLSALALLTQYFALFLIGAEALLLLYRRRDAGVVLALVALALVEATLIPHLVSHQAHPAGWIDNFRLSVRVRQVPVAFGFSPQYQSQTALSYGLLGGGGARRRHDRAAAGGGRRPRATRRGAGRGAGRVRPRWSRWCSRSSVMTTTSRAR